MDSGSSSSINALEFDLESDSKFNSYVMKLPHQWTGLKIEIDLSWSYDLQAD